MKAFWVIFFSLGAVSAMHLGYEVGQRYTHSYECDVTNAMPGSSTKTVGLQLKCDAHVDVIKKTEMQVTLANIQVNPVQGTRMDPTQQKDSVNTKVLDAMQKNLSHPVKFFVKASDGSINKICVHPKDTEWSLNVKRGLINLFQISGPLDQQYFIQSESTAVGECQVAYAIRRRTNVRVLELTKVINYNKCHHRAEFKQVNYLGEACQECQRSVGYSPYHRAVGQIDHTLTGSKDKGYTINRAEAYEDHVITPLSRAAGQVTARARQTLKFLKQTAAGAPSTDLTETVRMTFSAENPEAVSKYEKQQQQQIDKARECIQEMFKAAKDIDGPNVGEKFTSTVYALRRCTKETLKTLVDEMVKRKDQTERKLFLDAASFVGTCQAFEVLKENAKLFKQSELSRLFLGLAAAPEPRACHIKASRDLCNYAKASTDQSCHRQCLLSLGALLNKISRRPRFQQNPKDVLEYENSIKEMKNQLNNPNAKSDDKRMYIQALGNAGSCEVQDDLQNILKNKEQPLYIRVECVWALRRIVRQKRSKAKAYPCLISIFADPEECPELRMAIFVQILNTRPNFPTLQALASIVRREISNRRKGPQSNQLASFVFSHLSALAYQNNILTKRRAMQARLVLRLMPEMKFAISYSKGVRMAFNSEKSQSGIEIEANKLDLPESVFPRNLNTRLQLNILGFRLNALEFGARIENMDDIFEYIVSKIHKRRKRSLWGSVASIFNVEETDDSDVHSTAVSGNKSSQGSPIPISSDEGIGSIEESKNLILLLQKQRRMSAFIKFFGNELTFLEVRQENVDQLAQDLSDLLFGLKTKLEYPEQGIVITKNGVKIEQTLQKAFLGYHARHMIPTLAGIMLDMEFRAGTSATATTAATFGLTSSSWLTFWQYNKMTGNLRIKPRVNTHAHALVGIHTPLVRVGVQMKLKIRSYFEKTADVVAEKGKQCSVKFNIPDRKWDVWTVKVDTEGFTQECNPDTLKTTEKPISMELNRDHITQVQESCYGQDMFGVKYCVEGTFPDLTALRLQPVLVLPVIGQFDGRFTGAPAEDKPTDIQWLHKHPVVSKLGTLEISGEINVLAASKAVTRKIPYKITYKRGHQRELFIKFNDLQVKGYENAMMTLKVDSNGLKLGFGNEPGQKKPKYEITASGQVENQGKCLRTQVHWTMLPEQWKNFFYQWEPQIWNVLQQFAWVRRVNRQERKQMEFQIQLKTATRADWTLKVPNADVRRTNVLLPLRVEHFASSYDDIMNFVFARCDVQGQNIRVFDQLQYVANIKAGCQYILVQEHGTGKRSRFMFTVQVNDKGQKTLRILISESKEKVEINANDDHPTIRIDGQLCATQDCQTKLQDVTVHKAQMPGGKNQVQLCTKFGLFARIKGGQISVYASPLLQGHVRGLCGDANGEQWNEFRDRNDKIQNRQTFIKSWQQKC